MKIVIKGKETILLEYLLELLALNCYLLFITCIKLVLFICCQCFNFKTFLFIYFTLNQF